jgi:hypothetical protein
MIKTIATEMLGISCKIFDHVNIVKLLERSINQQEGAGLVGLE